MPKKHNTRLEIIRIFSLMMAEKGFNNTKITDIAKALDISKGNLTFYFPTKEHILDVMTDMLCDYQWQVMEKTCNEGYSSLLAYCLELSAMSALCEDNENARDFYFAAYTHPRSLEIIRKNDAGKTKQIFRLFCPDWTDEDFRAAEVIVSGIEYGALVEAGKTNNLKLQTDAALRAILRVYNVPEELIDIKIRKVNAIDYREIGNLLFAGFAKYLEDTINTASEYK